MVEVKTLSGSHSLGEVSRGVKDKEPDCEGVRV